MPLTLVRALPRETFARANAVPPARARTSPEATAALASIVNDTYGWFKGLVKERRGYDDAGLAAVSDGRIFTGKQALDLKLIDAVGDESDAIAWLDKAKVHPRRSTWWTRA